MEKEETKLNKNERFEDLGEGELRIIQNPNLYTFTSDSVHLLNFLKVKKSDSCLEIGSGTGIISILLAYRKNPKHIDCVEIQKEVAVLSQKNIALSNYNDKISVFTSDINDFAKQCKTQYDVVFSNPPYKKLGACFLNKNDSRAISRHEVCLTLSQLCKCASSVVKFGGNFYVIYDANRLAELIFELKKNNLEPKEIQLIYPTPNKPASQVIVRATKGGKEDIKINQPLILNLKDVDNKPKLV